MKQSKRNSSSLSAALFPIDIPCWSRTAVRRHEHDTGRYGVRRVAEPQFFAVREDGAFVVAATAGDTIEQFLLPLTLQRRHPQNLTRIELERNIVDLRTAAQPAYFQRCLSIARSLARGACRSC